MAKVEVTEFSFPQGWNDPSRAGELSRKYCEHLEDGDIVAFPVRPFEFKQEDRDFLLAQSNKRVDRYCIILM